MLPRNRNHHHNHKPTKKPRREYRTPSLTIVHEAYKTCLIRHEKAVRNEADGAERFRTAKLLYERAVSELKTLSETEGVLSKDVLRVELKDNPE